MLICIRFEIRSETLCALADDNEAETELRKVPTSVMLKLTIQPQCYFGHAFSVSISADFKFSTIDCQQD